MSWAKAVRSASRESWHRAFKEVSAIAFLSIAPLFAKAFYYFVVDGAEEYHYNYLEAFMIRIANGDLMIFSVANFAAIIWLSAQDYEDSFEERIWFLIISILGFGTCLFFIGLNPEFKVAPSVLAQIFSLVLFVVAFTLNVLILMFQHYNSNDFNNLQDQEDKAAAQKLRKLRRAK